MVLRILLISALVVSQSAMADISDTIRNSRAVVHYDFENDFNSLPDSGLVIPDKANPVFGAPLNLKWYATTRLNKISWGSEAASGNDGYLHLQGGTILRSEGFATKIYNQCRNAASTGLTIEALVENNDSVELRTGSFPIGTNLLQPSRIVSMSKDFTNRGTTVNVNFILGQVYEDGDRYSASVTNAASGNNLLANPLETSTEAVMLLNRGKTLPTYRQKVIFTLEKKTGFATLYLSDRNGNLYPAIKTQNGFDSNGPVADYFSAWKNDTYLNVGNDYIANVSTLGRNESFGDPGFTAAQADNPNRYWKGKMYRLAIYCDALTQEQVLGDAYKIVKNEIFPIVNVPRTPNLLKASEIYERLTGTKTPIYNPLLLQMEQRLNAGDGVGAASLVTEHPLFYNIVVRNFAGKMSNRDETINFPLNDFTATVIGAVRDNLNAKTLLSGNYFYHGDPTKAAVPSDEVTDILRTNAHYEALDIGNYNLKDVLMSSRQLVIAASTSNGNPSTNNNNIANITFTSEQNSWAAGLFTTRQWAQAHLVAGTNRRAAEYAFREFLCMPVENMADSTGPEDVIGRDIDRNPGGSRSKFTTSCRACHTILDGFRPAFAYMTFSNGFLKHSSKVPNTTNNNLDEDTSIAMRIHPDAPLVSRKMNHNNETFPDGRILRTDDWVNNANGGSNKTAIGWGPRMSGKGTAEFGKALAESKAFPKCMAKRVFFTVCKREPEAKDEAFIKMVADEFSTTERDFNLKYLFQKIVTNESCLGGN